MAKQVLLKDGDIRVYSYCDSHVYIQRIGERAFPLHVGASNVLALQEYADRPENIFWPELLKRITALPAMTRHEVQEYLSSLYVPSDVIESYLG